MALKAAMICTTHSGAITAKNRYEVPQERRPTQTLNCTDADTVSRSLNEFNASNCNVERVEKLAKHTTLITYLTC